MKFDVYCDECRPDLLGSEKPPADYMVLGSLWLKSEDRERFKHEVHSLRNKHKIGGEFKWRKATPSRETFYLELIDWFFAKEEQLRFRCIAVEHQKVNLLRYHESDQELGFYKFYYQMLHHWILDCNDYTFFCDYKRNRLPDRLKVLRRCLDQSNLSSTVKDVQAIRSKESVFLQIVDVLTGCVSAKINGILTPGGTKEKLIHHIEEKIGKEIAHTYRGEQKFNVFKIDLCGGW